jgi:ABC-2 type transport system ATP-binding protein
MVIEVSGLTKRYADVAVLSNVSFSVRENEILGIIGPNGAGKTTLLECLAGLLPQDGGEVRWQGGPLPAARRKKALFYLPDGVLPDNDQPSGGVLAFYREVFGASAAREREVVTQLTLGPVLTKRVDALSKGYRRRLLLAIALLAPQPLLLLDEPFDGFDLRQTLSVMALLRELAQSRRTLLLSIHQLADAERICDRLLLLDDGRALGIGTLGELRELAGGNAHSLEEVFLALT